MAGDGALCLRLGLTGGQPSEGFLAPPLCRAYVRFFDSRFPSSDGALRLRFGPARRVGPTLGHDFRVRA